MNVKSGSKPTKRCICDTPDPEPISDTIRTEVCRNCDGWFCMVVGSLAELEQVKQYLGGNGGQGNS